VLPIQDIYQSLLTTIQNNPMALLQAPPGAGKSTWLPLTLMQAGHFKRIVMLEPRRLAARNIAQYLASLQNEAVGESVGLRIRGESKISNATKLEIVTEGMLTRMLQNDPELSGVDLLIFDEFHERSIAADTALAFALETQAALRDDLKILLMSATLDGERYSEFFDCPIISSEGRSYPIDEIYVPLKDESRWLEDIPAVIKQALNEQTGSALVFLPGQREILRVKQALNDLADDCEVFTLFGEQSKGEQQAAIAPAQQGKRKVVLTTNVAETSLTIEGIRIVVDSGKRRAASFNLKTGVTELVTQSISRSSAVQRAGRAGRLEAGVVYRLGSKQTFERRNSHDAPEILTSDISQLLLETKQWGAAITELNLLDAPSPQQIKHATALLKMLEALDENEKLTKLGSQMLSFGADIRLSHMLIKAKQLQASMPRIYELAAYLVALLESRVSIPADLKLALHSMHTKPYPLFKQQLNYWLSRLNLKAVRELNMQHLALLVAFAFPDRLAKKRGNGYLLANGAGADLSDEFWHNDDYLAIASMGGHKGSRIFAAVAFLPDELEDQLGHLFSEQTRCEYDEKSGRFIHQEELKLGAITVASQPSKQPLDKAERTKAWLNLFNKKGFSLFNEQSESEQLLIRMSLASKLLPQSFPVISRDELTTNNQWLAPFLDEIKNVEQLKKLNYSEALKNCFDWHQQSLLNELLPLRLTVPSGSNVRITYQLDGPAKLSVRMQEVYGMTSTPLLAQGKLPLLMELLSPARRPLQLTQDLENFWQTSYKEVQKEMKGRYPKHFWPDNPALSQATNKVKSKM